MISTYCLEQGPGLHDAFVEERFTPFLGADCSSQRLDVAVGYPSASLNVLRREDLDGSARWDHFRFVAHNIQRDFVQEVFEGGQEQPDGLGIASDDTVIQEEGLEVDASWVLRLRDPCGFQDARVNGKCKKGRPKKVSLLNPCLTVNPRVANRQIGVLTIARVSTGCHRRKVFADRREHRSA